MEPRNIGVIVWADGRVAARFAGETRNGSVELNEPKYLDIGSMNAYRQWVGYWRDQIDRQSIRKTSGATVARTEPDFLDTLRTKSKRQYLLVDGGFYTKQIRANELNDVVDDLFGELVAVESEQEKSAEHREAARALYRASDVAMRESGLAEHPDFHRGYDWLCPVEETKQHFHFDYAIHQRKPARPAMVMMRVLLWRLQNVHSTAFRFQCMRSAYKLPRERCAALVYATESDLAENDDMLQAWRMMDSFGTVVNMLDVDTAARRLRSMSA